MQVSAVHAPDGDVSRDHVRRTDKGPPPDCDPCGSPSGFHHLPRAEDWPVMSTDWKTIHIKPHNFFTRNPALTIPSRD